MATTRRRVNAQSRRSVRVQASVGADVHARLCALASLRGVPASLIIAEAIGAAVSGIVVCDRRGAVLDAVKLVLAEEEAA